MVINATAHTTRKRPPIRASATTLLQKTGSETGVDGAAAVPEAITLTASSATTFSVIGSVSGALGTTTVATPFTSGQLNFTLAAGSTAFVAGDKFTVATTPGTLAPIPPITISNFADGATNQTFNWNELSGTAPLLTQVAAPSSTTSTQQDGSSSGSLVNLSIGSDGTVTGSFSNGETPALGQVALANFANVDGLQLDGTTNYSPTLASGPSVVGIPGEWVLGTLSGG